MASSSSVNDAVTGRISGESAATTQAAGTYEAVTSVSSDFAFSSAFEVLGGVDIPSSPDPTSANKRRWLERQIDRIVWDARDTRFGVREYPALLGLSVVMEELLGEGCVQYGKATWLCPTFTITERGMGKLQLGAANHDHRTRAIDHVMLTAKSFLRGCPPSVLRKFDLLTDNDEFVFDQHSGRSFALPIPPPPSADQQRRTWLDGMVARITGNARAVKSMGTRDDYRYVDEKGLRKLMSELVGTHNVQDGETAGTFLVTPAGQKLLLDTEGCQLEIVKRAITRIEVPGYVTPPGWALCINHFDGNYVVGQHSGTSWLVPGVVSAACEDVSMASRTAAVTFGSLNDASERLATSAERLAESAEQTSERIETSLDGLDHTASAVAESAKKASAVFDHGATVLRCLAEMFSSLGDVVKNINLNELAFTIVDFVSAWKSGPFTTYQLMNLSSRILGAFGYSMVEAVKIGAHWLKHALSLAEVREETEGDVLQQHAFEPLGFVGALSSAVMAGVLGTRMKDEHVRALTNMLRMHFSIVKSMEALGSVSDAITTYVPVALMSVARVLLPAQWIAWFYTPAVFEAWLKDMTAVTSFCNDPAMLQNHEFQLLVLETYVKYRDLFLTREKLLQWKPNEFRVMKEEFGKLTNMYRAIETLVNNGADRKTPTCVWLFGKSGVGKSTFLKAIFKVALGVDNLQPHVFNMNVGAKHYNGFLSQRAIRIEEPGQNRQSTGLFDLLNIVNTACFLPEMASIETTGAGAGKGTPMNVEFVGITSNLAFPVDINMETPSAVFRRRDILIEQDVKPGTGPLNQLDIETSKNFDFALYYLWCPTDHTVPRRGPFTADQILRFVYDVHTKKQAQQAAIIDEEVSSSLARRALGDNFKPIPVSETLNALASVKDYGYVVRQMRARQKDVPADVRDITETDPRTSSESGDLIVAQHAGESREVEAPPNGYQARTLKLRMMLARIRGVDEEKDFDDRVSEETEEEIASYGARSGALLKLLLSAGVIVGACVLLAKFFRRGEHVDAHAYSVHEVGRAVAPQKQTPVPLQVVSHSGVLNSTVWDEIAALSKNCVRISSGRHGGGGIFLGHRLLLTCRHVFCDAEGNIEQSLGCRVAVCGQVLDFEFTPSMIVREWKDGVGFVDAVVIDLSSLLAQDFKRVVNRFWTTAQRASFLGGAQWVFATTRGKETTMVTCNGARMVEKQLTTVGSGSFTMTRHAAVYNAACQPGDSGCCLMTSEAAPYRLVGIHVGGRADLGAGLTLVQEDFEGLFDTEVPQHAYANHVVDGQLPHVEGLRPVGILKPEYPCRMSDRTVLRETPQAVFLPPSPKAPARLRPFVKDGKRIDPVHLALTKLCSKTRRLNMEVAHRAARAVVEELQATMMGFGDRYDPLEDEEAIFGTEESFVDRINPNSSAGFPYKWEHPGKTGKRHLIDFENRKVLDPRVLERMHEREQALFEGRRGLGLASACMKDELRDLDRVEQGKTRLFIILPLDDNLVARKYLLRFCAAFYRRRTAASESQVGINATSDQWADMFCDLLKVSRFGFGSDTRNHDALMSHQLSLLVMDEIVIPYLAAAMAEKWQKRYETLLHNMAVEWSEYWVAVMNRVYQKMGVLPTGSIVTVVWNTILDMFVMRYLWIMMVEDIPVFADSEEELAEMNSLLVALRPSAYGISTVAKSLACGTTASYKRLTCPKHYGDDNIRAVADVIREYWHFQTYKIAMALYFAWEVTPPTKVDDGSYKLVPLMELDFLKRGFRFDRAWCAHGPVAPLAWESVVCPALWSHKTGATSEELLVNCNTSLREAALHGHARFTEWRELLRAALRDAGIEGALVTYAEARDIYLQGGYPDEWTTPGTLVVEAHASDAKPLTMGDAVANTTQAIGESVKKSALDIVANPLNLLDLLFDKPNEQREPSVVFKRNDLMANLDTATHHEILTNRSTYQFVEDPGATGTKSDQLNLKELARHPSLLDIFEVATSSATDTKLFSTSVTPFGMFEGLETGQKKCLTNLAFAAMFADLWRMPIKYTIMVLAPQQLSMRLKLAYTPGTNTDPTITQVNEGYYKVIDVNTEHQQFVVECRYIHHSPFVRSNPASVIGERDTLGRFSIWTAGSINAASNVPTKFYIAVFVSAGDDPMFINAGAMASCFDWENYWSATELEGEFQDAMDVFDQHSSVNALAGDTADDKLAKPLESSTMSSVGGFGATVTSQADMGVTQGMLRPVIASSTMSSLSKTAKSPLFVDTDAPLSFQRASSKAVPMAQYTVATNQPYGTVIDKFKVLEKLVGSNKLIQRMFYTARYFRGGVRLTFTGVGTRFITGTVIASLLYLPMDGTLTIPSVVDLRWMTSLPYVLIRLNAGETQVLEVPWVSPYSAYRTTDNSQYGREIAYVVIAHFAPVQVAAGTVGNPSLQVYGHTMEGEFSVPHITADEIVVQQHSDMSRPMTWNELEEAQGSILSATEVQAPLRKHAAEITSGHDVLKRFVFLSTIYPEAHATTLVPTSDFAMQYASISVPVRDFVTKVNRHTPLNTVSKAFGMWSGEINVKLNFTPTTLYEEQVVPTHIESGPATHTTIPGRVQTRQWMALVGYCPHPVHGSHAQDALEEFANCMGGGKNFGGAYAARKNSAWIPLSRCDQDHPWCNVTIPFISPYHGVFIDPGHAAQEENNPGYLFILYQQAIYSESAAGNTWPVMVDMAVAAGDSFRFSAWRGCPFVTALAGNGFGLYPAAIATP